jgi:hypothetical protein
LTRISTFNCPPVLRAKKRTRPLIWGAVTHALVADAPDGR